MLEDAVAQARGELAAAESVFGPEHPYPTKVRAKLARALGEAGATEDELPVRQRILADLLARNGAQDTDTAVAAHNYGFCLYECGRPEEAVTHIERAIRDITPLVRHDGSALFRLCRNLAVVLQAAGRAAEAIALLERILAQQAQNTTVTADDLRGARITLAEAYRVLTGPTAERGRARGEQLWLAIVHDQEQRADPDDAELLRLRNKLAVFYATTGRNRKALPVYRRNLEDRERVLGPEHQDTLLSRSNLAICHESLGDHEAAAALFAPLHEQRSRLLGADHADTLDTLDRYAMCLYRMRRYREAERHFALLVEARTRIGGSDDRARARYLSWIGWSRYRAGHRRRALEAMRASLAARERVLGNEHADTMLSRHAVGGVLHALRRYDEAIPLLELTLADRARILGPGRPDTVKTRSLLAKTLAATGRHDEAVARRRENHEALVRKHGAEDHETILALARVGDAEEEAERHRDALACYADALKIAEHALGPEHQDTVMCRLSVASRLLGQGSADEAAPLFQRVLENHRRNFGDDDERTLRIRRDLARCHDCAGRADRALADYRALLTDARRALSKGHELRRTLTADLAAPPVGSWWDREPLTGRRLWQVALGAVVIAEAADAGCTVDVLYKRRWLARSDAAAALRRSRGIASRDDLLRGLRDLAGAESPAPAEPLGPPASAEQREAPESPDPRDRPESPSPDRSRPCGSDSGSYSGSDSGSADPGPVSAWNIARYVDDVRDGVVAGYLAEPEAWELLELMTEPAARAYDSWAGFAADYIAGRTSELGLSGPPRPDWPTGHRRRIEAVDRLLDPRNADSPFNRAPWGTVHTTCTTARATVRTTRDTARTAEVH